MFVLCLLAASRAKADWRYYDSQGRPHVVPYYEQIPKAYRSQAVNLDAGSPGASPLERVELDAPSPEPQVKPAAEAPPAALPQPADNTPVKLFEFSLSRLPSSSELLALDLAIHFPNPASSLLSAHQTTGDTGWTFGTVVLGILLGVAAFFLIDRFNEADPWVKSAVVFTAIMLFVANVLVSSFASRLDSAVTLFTESMRLQGGGISISSVTPEGERLVSGRAPGPREPAPVEIPGPAGSERTTREVATRYVGTPKPGQHPKEYFEEVKKSLVEQSMRAQAAREQALEGSGIK